jgi:hypothetical protein
VAPVARFGPPTVHNRNVISIITFFVAPDHLAVAGAAETGPEAVFDCATFGNFDV